MPAPRRIGLAAVGRGLLGLAGRLPGLLELGLTLGPRGADSRYSLGAALARTARRQPGATALIDGPRRLSYAWLNGCANRLAWVFRQRGIGPGTVVALLSRNRPELLAAVAGLAKLGARPALLNSEQRGASLAASLARLAPTAAVVDPALAGRYAGTEAAPPPWWLGPGVDGPDLLAEAAEAPAGEPPELAEVRLGDPAFLIFTSGTTGLPKASRMSHQRWLGAGLMFGTVCLRLRPGDVLYCPLPLFHNHALTVCWGSAVMTGAALALRERFSASAFWDDCRATGATAIAYIGQTARYLLEQPPSPGDRAHGVTRAVGLGLRADWCAPFKERFGLREVYEYYGASELPSGCFNILNLEGTVGLCPSPWALVECDDEGRPMRGSDGKVRKVPDGQAGLLLLEVTRRFAFDGYTDEAASERKLVRGAFASADVWVSSGDLMRHIGFGHLAFVDRLGDTWRWKGENVAAAEVEAVARGVPGVRAAAAYGVEVPGATGRAGMLAVVWEDAPRLETLPVFLRVCAELETTSTFKLKKGPLKAAGYAPQEVSDPLYVLLPGARAWAPLDAPLHARLADGLGALR